jgi:hypothetical protein
MTEESSALGSADAVGSGTAGREWLADAEEEGAASACSKACMAAGKGLSNPSSPDSSELEGAEGLKGNPPVMPPMPPSAGLGAAGAAMAPMARKAMVRYEVCILLVDLKRL